MYEPRNPFSMPILCGIVIFSLVSVLRAEDPVQAGHPPVGEMLSDTQTVMAFADHLYRQGDYYRAITEYERVAYTKPGNAQALQAEFQIGMCYVRAEKWDLAVRAFLGLKDRHVNEAFGRKAALELGETYYRMGKYGKAVDVLEEYVKQNPDGPDAAEAQIRLGLSYLQFGNVDWARESFRDVPTNSPVSARAIALEQQSRGYSTIPHKSTRLAAGLSAVLPGAGQLYIRRPGDAFVAFALNGLMIGGVLTAFQNDEPVVGSLFLLIEVSWYCGNIYNAANGANSFNQRQKDAFFHNIEFKYGVMADMGEASHALPAVGVGVRF